MKKLFLILLLIFIVGCIPKNAIWLEKEPIQCLGNEWEQDYLEIKNIQANEYPIQDENKIIEEYYLKQGVKIYQIEKEKVSDFTCASCDCKRGDKIKILVSEKDINKMNSFDWK